MRVFTGNGSEDAKSRGHGIATALKGQLDDVFRIEIERVLGETRTRGMFDALIDGKNGNVAGAREAASVVNPVEVVEDTLIPVGRSEDAVHEIRTGQMQKILGDLGLVVEEGIGLVAEERDDVFRHGGEDG